MGVGKRDSWEFLELRYLYLTTLTYMTYVISVNMK